MAFPGSIYAPPGVYDAIIKCGICKEEHFSMGHCQGWPYCYPKRPEDFLAAMVEVGFTEREVHVWVESMKMSDKSIGRHWGRHWLDTRVVAEISPGRRIDRHDDGTSTPREEITFSRVVLHRDFAPRVRANPNSLWHIIE